MKQTDQSVWEEKVLDNEYLGCKIKMKLKEAKSTLGLLLALYSGITLMVLKEPFRVPGLIPGWLYASSMSKPLYCHFSHSHTHTPYTNYCSKDLAGHNDICVPATGHKHLGLIVFRTELVLSLSLPKVSGAQC